MFSRYETCTRNLRTRISIQMFNLWQPGSLQARMYATRTDSLLHTGRLEPEQNVMMEGEFATVFSGWRILWFDWFVSLQTP
jgi:hypothetical protein